MCWNQLQQGRRTALPLACLVLSTDYSVSAFNFMSFVFLSFLLSTRVNWKPFSCSKMLWWKTWRRNESKEHIRTRINEAIDIETREIKTWMIWSNTQTLLPQSRTRVKRYSNAKAGFINRIWERAKHYKYEYNLRNQKEPSNEEATIPNII